MTTTADARFFEFFERNGGRRADPNGGCWHADMRRPPSMDRAGWRQRSIRDAAEAKCEPARSGSFRSQPWSPASGFQRAYRVSARLSCASRD